MMLNRDISCSNSRGEWKRAESLQLRKKKSIRGNVSFIGRTDAEAETPILWPPDEKNWLIGKDSDAGREWGQEEKGTTEHEMAGWHHWLDGHESEWTLGVGDGQGGLACCDSWGHKESDMTEQLNELNLSTGERHLNTKILAFFLSPFSYIWNLRITSLNSMR